MSWSRAAAIHTATATGVSRITVASQVATVPAGSLDSDPGIRVQAHIFVDSKAGWDRITDQVPQFSGMPPR